MLEKKKWKSHNKKWVFHPKNTFETEKNTIFFITLIKKIYRWGRAGSVLSTPLVMIKGEGVSECQYRLSSGNIIGI